MENIARFTRYVEHITLENDKILNIRKKMSIKLSNFNKNLNPMR